MNVRLPLTAMAGVPPEVLEGGRGDTYPDMAWEPKAAFRTVAECYRS